MSKLSKASNDLAPLSNIKSALKFSTVEGMAYGSFLGFGDHYIIAFAIALGTNSFEIGILSAVPGFLASLAQLLDAQLVRRLKSRKAVILTFALIQGLIFLPILTLAFLNLNRPGWWLVLLTSVYSICGAMISPAWGSLMADIVPDRLRGRYFSARGRLSTLALVVTFLLAGIFLNYMVNRALWGFAVLFGIAVVTRLISWVLLTKLYDKPGQVGDQKSSKRADNSREVSRSNLGRYMLFLFAMAFAVNIASPYFTVYELRELKFSYTTFATLETVFSLAMFFTITHWGRAADRAGNLKLLIISSALIPFVPLIWMVSSNVLYLSLVQVITGIAWAGFNLCSVNYLYDATTTDNRTRYLAYFNAGAGTATGLGALIGGYIMPSIPAIRGSHILTLFSISGILRGLVCLVFLLGLKEVRKVGKVPAAELFHILTGGRPVVRHTSHRKQMHIHHHE